MPRRSELRHTYATIATAAQPRTRARRRAERTAGIGGRASVARGTGRRTHADRIARRSRLDRRREQRAWTQRSRGAVARLRRRRAFDAFAPPAVVGAEQTWYFQFGYRNPAAGGAGINLS